MDFSTDGGDYASNPLKRKHPLSPAGRRVLARPEALRKARENGWEDGGPFSPETLLQPGLKRVYPFRLHANQPITRIAQAPTSSSAVQSTKRSVVPLTVPTTLPRTSSMDRATPEKILTDFIDRIPFKNRIAHIENVLDCGKAVKAAETSGSLPESCKNPVSLLMEFFSLPGGKELLEWSEAVDANGGRHPLMWKQNVSVCGKVFEVTRGNKKVAKTALATQAVAWLFDHVQNIPLNVKPTSGRHPSTLPAVPVILTEAQKTRLRSSRRSEDTGDSAFANKIAELVHEKFADSAERFKLEEPYRKYAVLAGVVIIAPQGLECICVATGTKCLGPEQQSFRGLTVKDMHAEILALRSFKQFLFSQVQLWCFNQRHAHRLKDDTDCVLVKNAQTGRLRIRPGVSFSLYISSAPCGDSRVFSLSDFEEGFDSHPQRVCRGQLRLKIEAGMGGVTVPTGHSGQQHWDSVLGGERLCVMSCSDKLLRRNLLGVQGALLSLIMDPVYLKSVVVGHLFNADHMQRALFSRLNAGEDCRKKLEDLGFSYRSPLFLKSMIGEKRMIAPKHNMSVLWVTDGESEEFELLDCLKGKTAEGKASCVAKTSLMKALMSQWALLEPFLPHLKALRQEVSSESPTYSDVKHLAKDYYAAQILFEDLLKDGGLQNWVRKVPEEERFSAVPDSGDHRHS